VLDSLPLLLLPPLPLELWCDDSLEDEREELGWDDSLEDSPKEDSEDEEDP